ncbi:metalloregulator ArsR/SmtB family transcription factor [Hyphomonas sp.]|jgi:DNA-binding transcriptional ArsR family regulator|uniref:ArsR/SmtB family transcription factor n=1 Tax=Hyphomonas sp. TaxID=87 RepID=UPI0032D99776
MPDQDVFRAIADPTRRAIMSMLVKCDLRVSDIASQFEMSRPAVSKHLAQLEAADLILVERQGREAINKLNPEGLKPVAEWLTFFSQFWDDKLANLKQAVEGSDD